MGFHGPAALGLQGHTLEQGLKVWQGDGLCVRDVPFAILQENLPKFSQVISLSKNCNLHLLIKDLLEL